VLREKLKARPDIVVERHHVPLPRHRYAREAAVAACCANEQGAEERFIDAIVDREVYPTATYCREVVEKLGLDVGKFDECVSSDRPTKRMEASKALLDKTGFVGLPTVDLEDERSLGLLDDARADAFLGRHK
jgi:protein-disulfide isomerase-like protein with CxxC motif